MGKGNWDSGTGAAELKYIRIDRGGTAKIKTAGLNFRCKVAKIKLGGLKMGKWKLKLGV